MRTSDVFHGKHHFWWMMTFNWEIDYLDVNDLVNWSMLRSQEKGLGKLEKQVCHGGSKHDKFRV